MKKSFQKSLIAASMGVAMLAATGTASANSLLFPYFTTASGAQSVLSLNSDSNQALHYVYNYTNESDACAHYDGVGAITANDLIQHSVASTTAGGFGKAVGSDTSTPFYFPLANNSGFLVVTGQNNEGSISGDIAIVDPSTGLVVSYAGITNTSGVEGDFSNILDSGFNLTTYAAPLVDTYWYGVVAGDMSAAIFTNRDWTATASLNNGGVVYDNDEHVFSGTKTRTLTCAGRVTPADLATTAQQAAVGPNGALVRVSTTFDLTASGDQGTGLVLSKLQTVKAAAGAPFAGKQFLHREPAASFNTPS